MLTSDFFVFTTTSRQGSQFHDFRSQTYRELGFLFWRLLLHVN